MSAGEYHPRELGFGGKRPTATATGIFGALVMLGFVFVCAVVALVGVPLVAFGVAEVVYDSPTCWRWRIKRKQVAP